MRHIRAVNNAFAAIVDGNYGRLFDALQPCIRNETAFEPYCRTLAGVRRQYQYLSAQDKTDLATAVALHDIGYLRDQGIDHNVEGAKMVSEFLMTNGIYGVDRMAVSEMINAHGLLIDATAQFLPSDLRQYSPTRKTQLLVLGIADCVGKPSGSNLSQRVLNTLINMKNGVYEDPQKFFDLRLRSLLGPTNFSYIESNVVYNSLKETIDASLAPEQKASLIKNVANRFRNMCWPVFQELVMNHQGIRQYLIILDRLAGVADTEFPDKRSVRLEFFPDFFMLSSEQRQPYIAALKANPKGRYLMVYEMWDTGVISLDLNRLVSAPF
ncbi:MAG: HD domain-containing protein [Candidatus Margulisbacteria bacterium]|nr:HD domain-containing protein [Candidatus Margulisiibacteriota bacterium]